MKRKFAPLITAIGKRIENNRFSDSPIFIGGCGRSGTTLLLSILSSHNDIFACPKELNLFNSAEMKDEKFHAPYFYRLHRTFITSKIKKTALRYCEKSPSNIKYVDLINEVYHGKFRFIQIVRDGRDVILSRHPRKKDDYWVEPERWINDVGIGMAYRNHPNVHTITYEKLVENYQETIAGICDFLKIPLSREILNWHSHTTVRQYDALHEPIREINNASIGKWKKEKNKERVELLMSQPGALELLKAYNYL